MAEKTTWQKSICEEWKRRHPNAGDAPSTPLFPLCMNPFGEEEILAMTEVLLTGQLTLGKNVTEAETLFAKIVGAPYAVMVNSGSSANLLAVAAIANKLRPVHCETGDEVLVPAVAWSTSVHPLIQCGLKPVFVDVDPCTMNVTVEDLEAKMSPRVKAVMAVHVLGNSINMKSLAEFVKRHNLILVEDTCESLGSFFDDDWSDPSKPLQKRMLGTMGDFGSYSFYFSHHITSGEGGMVVCKTEEDYNFVRCLRAHGWTRHQTNRFEVEARYPEIDSRFLFINVGYNLRPMEVQGAMAVVQMHKLDEFNQCRRDNLSRIYGALQKDARFSKYMSIMQPAKGTDPAWFGLSVMLHRPYAHQRSAYVQFLEKNGIENRPVISGNFTRQPCIKAYCEGELPENYPGAEAIHTRGFFIGIHQIRVSDETISKLVSVMLSFPFVHHHVTLVTGSEGSLGSHIHQAVADFAKVPVSQKLITTSNKDGTETEWIFTTRKDGNLADAKDVQAIFKKFQPTRVLHTAASHSATSNPVDLWLENVSINNNLLKTAFDFQAWAGPIKVVSVLSTVMLPTKMDAVGDLFLGPPADVCCESYAYAKRSLAQLSKWYRTQYGPRANFVTVLPGHFFGPFGPFDATSPTAAFVNGLVAKIATAKSINATTLQVACAQDTVHRMLYAPDLAQLLIWSLDTLEDSEPLILAGEDITTSKIVEIISKAMGFTGKIEFSPCCHACALPPTSARLSELYPSFKFTPTEEAIHLTIKSFKH